MEYLPVTPPQKFMLEEMPTLKYPGRWCVEVLVKTKARLDENAMKEAASYVVNKYESLRTRFRMRDGEWCQEIYPLSEANVFSVYDLSGEDSTTRLETMTRISYMTRDAFVPEEGNLAKVIFFRWQGNEGRLWFCLHHILADFVSFLIFTRDFMAAYTSLVQRKELKWQMAKDYRKMLYLLDGYCRDVLMPAQMDYWLSFPWDDAKPVPSDYRDLLYNHASIKRVVDSKILIDFYTWNVAALEGGVMQGLLSRYGNEVENVLIAVFFLAVTDAMKIDCMDMNVSNSGRNILPPEYGINFFHLMGYLSVNRVVLLRRPNERNLPSDVQAILDEMKKVPGGGVGYELIADYIKSDSVRNSFRTRRRKPYVFFNYIGRIDSSFDSDVYEIAPEDIGLKFHQSEVQYNMLECRAWIEGSQLFFKYTYCTAIHRPDTIAAIAESMLQMIRELSVARTEVIEKIA